MAAPTGVLAGKGKQSDGLRPQPPWLAPLALPPPAPPHHTLDGAAGDGLPHRPRSRWSSQEGGPSPPSAAVSRTAPPSLPDIAPTRGATVGSSRGLPPNGEADRDALVEGTLAVLDQPDFALVRGRQPGRR
jgi:hypothetical protein